MFSGIVESQARVLSVQPSEGLLRIVVERPAEFTDLRTGDSICTNGVCLTVEAFDAEKVTFALGAETLKITGWSAEQLDGAMVNLERSLRFGDRMHGHMVSGHVDATGEIAAVEDLGGSVQIDIKTPAQLLPYVWKKGSWAVNGVSLTVNDVKEGVVSVCLIPETLKRTNLGNIRAGAHVNLEIDMMARGLIRYLETAGPLSSVDRSAL